MLMAGWLDVQEPSDLQPIPVPASQGKLPPGAALHPEAIKSAMLLAAHAVLHIVPSIPSLAHVV